MTISTDEPAALLDVRAVAAMLGCSQRHVYRLADAGRLPSPVKLGALVRWRLTELHDWLEAGCPSISLPDTDNGDSRSPAA